MDARGIEKLKTIADTIHAEGGQAVYRELDVTKAEDFIRQKSGHILTVSSVAALKAYPNGAVYGGTKWFVRDFMEVMSMESALERTNIRTATIYPAAINTELLQDITDKVMAEVMGAFINNTAYQ